MSRRSTKRPTTRAALAFLIALTIAPGGCGYSIRPPFDKSFKTIYVPMFRTLTFRRDLNLQMTRAIIAEIERRTPYKVVGTPEGADVTLDGTVELADKNLTVENPNNLPRQLLAILAVNARVSDNRIANDKLDKPWTNFTETVAFYPELGETVQLAYQKAIASIASQIVGALELPWTEEEPSPIVTPN